MVTFRADEMSRSPLHRNSEDCLFCRYPVLMIIVTTLTMANGTITLVSGFKNTNLLNVITTLEIASGAIILSLSAIILPLLFTRIKVTVPRTTANILGFAYPSSNRGRHFDIDSCRFYVRLLGLPRAF
jgi:hypothetical protein